MDKQHCMSCGSPLKQGAKFCPSCGVSILQIDTMKAGGKNISSAPVNSRHGMSSTTKAIYSALTVLLFGIFLFLFISHLPGRAHPVIEKQPDIAMPSAFTGVKLDMQHIELNIANNKISFPLTVLLNKKFVSFVYTSEHTSVPLIAYISPEGKLVTAVGICEPCNSRTYRIVDDILACGNCETEWKLNNLGGLQGSCQKYPPDPIPSQIIGNQVQIDEQTVKQWKMRI